MLCGGKLETAGMVAELADLDHHVVDELFQRGSRLLALATHMLLLAPRFGQQCTGCAHAAHAGRLINGQGTLQGLALAAGPTLVLGQFHEPGAQLAAQRR